MSFIFILLAVYLLIGAGYVLFLLTQRPLNVLTIPIDLLGGPIYLVHNLYKYLVKKDLNPANIRHKDILKGKKAVFFDLDGTIWDSDLAWLSALREVSTDNNLLVTGMENIYSPGMDLKSIWKNIQLRTGFNMPKNKNIDVLAKETEQKLISYIKKAENPSLMEGFTEAAYFFKVEKGFKLALVTNSGAEVTKEITERTGVSTVFDLIITGDDVSKKKPSPNIFLKAARRLKVSPKEVIVFEDSLSGSQAAAKAGMDQIIIWRTETPQVSYKGNIYGFYPDFIDIGKILEKTSRERVLESIENIRKNKEEESTITPESTQ
mgnify:CR=1 FL=1